MAAEIPTGFQRTIEVLAVKEEDGTYSVRVRCLGFDTARLTQVFSLVESFADEGTFITMPGLQAVEEQRRDAAGEVVTRPRALTLPDMIVPGSENESPPAGYRLHLTENGTRVFLRIAP